MARRQADDQLALNCCDRTHDTIKPSFGPGANSDTAPSVSPAMCKLIGLSSTPRGPAAAPTTAHCAESDLADRFPDYTDTRDLRCDLLEQFKPFAGQSKFELGKTSGVAARTRNAPDKAGPDRVDGLGHHNRHGAGRLL